MKLRDRLFTALLRRTYMRRDPDFAVIVAGRPYLKRWHVIPRNRFFNVYLHNFLRSDDGRALHDHQYWSLSWLLHGEIVEHTIAYGGVHHRRRIGAGQWRFRSPWCAHRVEATGKPAWTLFITGPRVREWGFHCEHGWVPWQVFTQPENKGEVGRGCEP